MPPDLLLELGLTPQQTVRLSGRMRGRLVGFLLRWQQHSALTACLDQLLPAYPTLVSLLDAKAMTCLKQGRLDAALDTMRERHRLRTSMSSQALLARIHLARQEVQTALDIAQKLVTGAPDRMTGWRMLGDVKLAAGDHEGAHAAYLRLHEIHADSRTYLLGMMALHRARGDWIAASAYAVRLQQAATAEAPLSVTCLRQLRDYFQASQELHRVADIETELAGRYATELADLRKALTLELLPGHPPPRPGGQTQPEPAGAVLSPPVPSQPPSSFAEVSVSSQERGRLEEEAQRIFGFERLWPGQAEIMACAMRGEAVLAVLPTGGGKSLCYQLPALLEDSGTTLVISPLIALMKDQLDKLPVEATRLATTINSSLEGQELRRRLNRVRAGHYRLVYAAPERLRQAPFVHALRQSGLNRLVIDEVHCVSMWGHDFRPDYLYIDEARHLLGDPPLLAFTATAPPRVRRDILQRLGDMHIVAGDVMRSNLRLEVFRARSYDDKLQYLLGFCRNEPGAGIIYARTRKRCEALAELLRSQGVSAIHYHAGIDDRAAAQDEFMTNRARVVVATIAFGMGIDKPDIRFILHVGPPASLEQYYQEAGRAGRDGRPARCVLLYSPSDRALLSRHARQDALSNDFLEGVYRAVKVRLGSMSLGRIAVDDLRRDLQVEETPVRVGISILEQAGMLRRWQDIPRTVTLRLKAAVPSEQPELAAFCGVARLQPGQSLDRDLVAIAQQADLDLRHLERQVLGWAEAGWLECRFSGRDPLLELLSPTADTRQRLDSLLDQYDKVQGQRVAKIVGYATTRRCRHGHISAYLGGRTIARCTACDNCLGSPPTSFASVLPDEQKQFETILRSLAASHGWGQRNLTYILLGSPEAPGPARSLPGFGELAFRSQTAIGHMLQRLVKAKLLCRRELPHGGVMIELTPAGRRALNDPFALRAMAEPVAKATGRRGGHSRRGEERGKPPRDVSIVRDDDQLFRRLRAWRLDKAREEGVPAFRVAHNSVLRSIAAGRPRTERELCAIRGIGPRKLEKYGAELLSLVREGAERTS